MASELVGKYLIVSRPEYRSEIAAWTPYVNVVWRENGEKLRYQIFGDSGKRFEREKEAESFGLTIARVWIQDQL
jgi:hypothetical protein